MLTSGTGHGPRSPGEITSDGPRSQGEITSDRPRSPGEITSDGPRSPGPRSSKAEITAHHLIDPFVCLFVELASPFGLPGPSDNCRLL